MSHQDHGACFNPYSPPTVVSFV